MRWSYLSHVGPRQVETIQCIFIYIIYPESLFLFVSFFLATLKKLFFLLLSFIVSCVLLLIFLLTVYLLSTLWCFEMMVVLYKQVWQSNYLRNCLKIFTETLTSSTGCSRWWSGPSPGGVVVPSAEAAVIQWTLCSEPSSVLPRASDGNTANWSRGWVLPEGGGWWGRHLPLPPRPWTPACSCVLLAVVWPWSESAQGMVPAENYIKKERVFFSSGEEVRWFLLFYFFNFFLFFFFLFETASFQVQQRYALGYGINSIYTSLKCLWRNST